MQIEMAVRELRISEQAAAWVSSRALARCIGIGFRLRHGFLPSLKTTTDEQVGPRKRIIIKGGEGAATRVVGLLFRSFQCWLRAKKWTFNQP